MRLSAIILVLMFVLVISMPFVLSHAENRPAELKEQAQLVLFLSGILIVVITIISLIIQKKKINGPAKVALFLMIAAPALLATFYVAGTTILVNQKSITKGPVHWHADFEVWNCGRKLDLQQPTELSNRIGTPLFHEHGDDRIHVEGVVDDYGELSLPHFFAAIGGKISDEELVYPTDLGQIIVTEGDQCNGRSGKIQVFVYRAVAFGDQDADVQDSFRVIQQKLASVEEYSIAHYSSVPPGDCLIIEFDQPKKQTERICESYRLRTATTEAGGGDAHGR